MPHRLYVFGSNSEGQLGIPAAEIVSSPTEVSNPPSLENLKAIRCGDNHTLFLISNGIVYGLGDNRKGQLSSHFEDPPQPGCFTTLSNDTSFIAATCESSAYIIGNGVTSSSCVRTEGSGQWGELGRGDDISTTASGDKELLSPSSLPGPVVDFAAGVWHYVALLEDGSVYGWGKARLGQLGGKLSGKISTPTRLETIPFKPVKVVCGKDFTYLLGDPASGTHILLGKDKFSIDSKKPEHVKDWKDVGATWHAIFVLFNDGTLTAWGKENMWQLQPPDLPLIEKIAIGSDHVLAVTKEGKLLSWGWGKHGNCGDLSNIKHEVKNDMVSGFWNEIDIPGEIVTINAGFCTSFVITK